MLNEIQQKRLLSWQTRNQSLYGRVMLGRAAHVEAIACMCLQCVGEDRTAIRKCRDMTCPIWHFRPFQESQ